jgi:gamma-glutamylcyclotransferase
MHYFSYASNLDPDQMLARAPGHRVIGLAELRDHRLTFPRYSARWGGGTSSVQSHHGESVWGVLFEVSDEDLASLDRHEGFRGPGNQHNEYDRVDVFVELTRPDDGSVPRRVRAAIYIARAENPQPPSRRYLDAILRGAAHHRLPEDYVAQLRRTSVLDEAGA